MAVNGRNTAAYPSFDALTQQNPAVFVKIPATGVWGLNGDWTSSTSVVTNVDGIRVGQATQSGFNTGAMQYRVYRPATSELLAATVKTGYGMNIFDANENPTFASSVRPLLLDYVGIIDSGLATLDGISTSQYVGSEIDLGVSSPWIYVLGAEISCTYFVSANQRRVHTLIPVYYHTNGTCRARFYVFVQVVTAALALVNLLAPAGDTYKHSILALSD